MNEGAWFQFGDRSQRMVLEQLQNGNGTGVIISPRHMSMRAAVEYSEQYGDLGAEVLIDHQFYEPGFDNRNLETYGINEFRESVSELNQISDVQLDELSFALSDFHQEFQPDAIIAPAFTYENGRPDIVEVNLRLFGAAKRVGDELGIPTYATVFLGSSAVANSGTIDSALANATANEADGWYYSFEFEQERIPTDEAAMYRCLRGGLTLACTGLPVLHAYAGPMAPISFGFGVTGAAIGHNQKLWKFTREIWQDSDGQGGGGDAPARFWSTSLWGTIVYPDETIDMPPALRNAVLTQSPFSQPVASGQDWPKWNANKHLLYVLGQQVAHFSTFGTARTAAAEAVNQLNSAVELHQEISAKGIYLRDQTNAYQEHWATATNLLLEQNGDDFDYLEMIS